jgi:hypothetical protein
MIFSLKIKLNHRLIFLEELECAFGVIGNPDEQDFMEFIW